MAPNGVCPFILTRKLVLHTILTLILVLVQSTQGVILDMFLISADPHSRAPYFWLISDFLIMFLFGITMVRSYSYWKRSTGNNSRFKSNDKLAEARRTPSFLTKHKSLLGSHPLCYITWFCYSVLLVIKVALIYKRGIINHIKPDSYLGPQLMNLCLGLTAVVFFLFVEGHYDAARNSQQATYIASLVKNNTFEIFDSVTFLSLLIVRETHMFYSFEFQNIIIAFACINLLLPNFCFYKLSLNDYGRVTTSAIMSFIYKILHLLLVNIPYMVVRIYLWLMMDAEVSIFLVKNVLHIALAVLDCKPDVKVILASYYGKSSDTSSTIAGRTRQSSLDDTTCKVVMDEGESFVTIDLKRSPNGNETLVSSYDEGEHNTKPSAV